MPFSHKGWHPPIGTHIFRDFLERNGTNYTYENLYEIAQGQLAAEDERYNTIITDKNFKENAPLFIDTNLYVIKVWSEFVFNKCDNRILTDITKREYELYLLCDIDLPWVKDNLREYPDLKVRQKLFHYYKEEMIAQKTVWKIIRGNHEKRLADAVKFTEHFLK